MKTESKYNLEKLVKVRVNDFCPARHFKYLTEKPKKYFWQTYRKEGVYFCAFTVDYVDEIPDDLFVKDNNVYEKPEVILIFESGVETTRYFDTYEAALTFAKELTKGENWLLI